MLTERRRAARRAPVVGTGVVLFAACIGVVGCGATLYVDRNGNPNGAVVPVSAQVATMKARTLFGCSDDAIKTAWRAEGNRYATPHSGETDLCDVVGRFGVLLSFVSSEGPGLRLASFEVAGSGSHHLVTASFYEDTPVNRRIASRAGVWFVDHVTTR